MPKKFPDSHIRADREKERGNQIEPLNEHKKRNHKQEAIDKDSAAAARGKITQHYEFFKTKHNMYKKEKRAEKKATKIEDELKSKEAELQLEGKFTLVPMKTALEMQSYLEKNCDMIVTPGTFQDSMALESIYNQA